MLFHRYCSNFINFSYTQNIDDTSLYCYGVSWDTEGFTSTVNVEEFVDECTFGALGLLQNRGEACRGRRYIPDTPIW